MRKQAALLSLVIVCVFSVHAETGSLQTFPLTDVRLLDGPFKHAEQNNLSYLLALEPDRLLAPFRREAGIESNVESYGNWESSGLDGHIGGHYLSALALMVASTGNKEVRDRLNYMIDELAKCQNKNNKGLMAGYIGGIPGGEALWKEIAAGNIKADNFSLNGKWVPWYNLHKLYAGLRDAYYYAGNVQAREMLIKLGDWSLNLVADLSNEQIQQMLRTEHGGMNEVFADIAALTGDKQYLELARKFSDQSVLQPLQKDKDRLTGLHANTQIPKVIGFARVAEVANDGQWSDAAEFFWDTVVNGRTVAIGGNSVREHFHSVDDFKTMTTEPEGPETCNTYNMLRLSKMLYQESGGLKYIDYYERALYNHILSSQHPDHGGLVYFTPMRPQHYRVYSQPDKAMWCCVGSGIENHGKYGELIYAHKGNELYVNLFIHSELNWKEKNIRLTQETMFPDQDSTKIIFESIGGTDNELTLKLRYPAWVRAGALKVSVNGKPVKFISKPGEYIAIERKWKTGDSVSIALPMQTRLEQMPDKSSYYAVVHGPIVLAAKTDPFKSEQLEFLADDSRMGHVAQGELCPIQASPVFVGDPDDFLKKIKPVPGKPLTFVAPGLIDTPEPLSELELIPFFRLHDSRYVVYWPASSRQDLPEFRKGKAEKARLALEAVTLDYVAPGEQQPESDHAFKGEGTEAGVHLRRHWRHAHQWFSYTLKDKNREAKILQMTYYGGDAGRSFDILINNKKIASVALDGSRGPEFYAVDYPIPEKIVKESPNGSLTVKFVAHKDSIAGGIYGVRLLSAPADSP